MPTIPVVQTLSDYQLDAISRLGSGDGRARKHVDTLPAQRGGTLRECGACCHQVVDQHDGATPDRSDATLPRHECIGQVGCSLRGGKPGRVTYASVVPQRRDCGCVQPDAAQVPGGRVSQRPYDVLAALPSGPRRRRDRYQPYDVDRADRCHDSGGQRTAERCSKPDGTLLLEGEQQPSYRPVVGRHRERWRQPRRARSGPGRARRGHQWCQARVAGDARGPLATGASRRKDEVEEGAHPRRVPSRTVQRVRVRAPVDAD
jgi:hypothetical protein